MHRPQIGHFGGLVRPDREAKSARRVESALSMDILLFAINFFGRRGRNEEHRRACPKPSPLNRAKINSDALLAALMILLRRRGACSRTPASFSTHQHQQSIQPTCTGTGVAAGFLLLPSSTATRLHNTFPPYTRLPLACARLWSFFAVHSFQCGVCHNSHPSASILPKSTSDFPQ